MKNKLHKNYYFIEHLSCTQWQKNSFNQKILFLNCEHQQLKFNETEDTVLPMLEVAGDQHI